MTFPFPLPPRYEVSDERLEGGQGFVFICTDQYLKRKVAIKVMKQLSDIAVLRREIRTLSEVRSRHVAELYDLVVAKRSGMCGLVEEYVPGLSLADYVRTANNNDYLRVLWQIACGVADIHAHGKIHRDIKPGNVRFDSEGILKILDFGLAMDRTGETIHARGTRFYLAPELFGTPPIKVRKTVDVYAFGVMAWYIGANGRLHRSMREIPPASQNPMPSFSSLGIALPADLIVLLDRTIDVNPSLRPRMAEVQLVLERHLLYGRHRAHIGSRTLSEVGESATLRAGANEIVISYDGLTFSITSVQGDAYVNNVAATAGRPLPGSCVITLGHPSLANSRSFVPVDMSHPGVVI